MGPRTHATATSSHPAFNTLTQCEEGDQASNVNANKGTIPNVSVAMPAANNTKESAPNAHTATNPTGSHVNPYASSSQTKGNTSRKPPPNRKQQWKHNSSSSKSKQTTAPPTPPVKQANATNPSMPPPTPPQQQLKENAHTAKMPSAQIPTVQVPPTQSSPHINNYELPRTNHEPNEVSWSRYLVGLSDSKKRTMEAAKKTFDAWRNCLGETLLYNMKYYDIVGEKLEEMFLKFATYLMTAHIPWANNNSKSLALNSRLEYFSAIKEILLNRFPDHPRFAEPALKNWYKRLRDNIEKKFTTERMDKIQNGDSMDRGTKPIYRRTDPSFYRVDDRERMMNDGIDLESLCFKLMQQCKQGNSSMQKRALLVITFHAMARGGEARFVKFNDMRWDGYYLSPDMQWFQVKTAMQTPMIFVCDYDSYKSCFYHAIACYFSMDKGLIHPHPKDGGGYLFPSLVGDMQREHVTKFITQTIKALIDTEDNGLSARSLRYGCVTYLTARPDITDAELNARGGWASSESRSDCYVDCNPALVVPAGAALAGWPDAHQYVYPPTLEGCQPVQIVKNFVSELFPTNIKQFEENGYLRPFLNICAASIIMYHYDLLKDLSSNNAMVLHTMAVCGRSGVSAAILKEWSLQIRTAWEDKNALGFAAKQEKDTMKTQNTMLAEMNNKINRQLKEIREENKELKDSVSVLHHEQIQWQQERQHLVKQTENLSKGMDKIINMLHASYHEGPTNQKRQRLSRTSSSSETPSSPSATSNPSSTSNKSSGTTSHGIGIINPPENIEVAQSAKAVKPEPQSVGYGIETRLAEGNLNSIEEILSYICDNGGFLPGSNTISTYKIPHLKEQNKLEKCLTYVDSIITGEELAEIRCPFVSRSYKLDLFKRIDARANELLKEKELKYGLIKTGKRTKTNYAGVCNRLGRVKDAELKAGVTEKGQRTLSFK